MPFAIQWVESCEAPDHRVTLVTPFAVLALSLCGDVICDADWLIDCTQAKPSGHPLQQTFDRYWMDSRHHVVVRLLCRGSAYRNRVWAELCRIPAGTTLSYSELAGRIGSSPRAVGNACRDNPYPLIIPCHRVVSATGLGGYCGQTDGDYLALKSRLLKFEARGES